MRIVQAGFLSAAMLATGPVETASRWPLVVPQGRVAGYLERLDGLPLGEESVGKARVACLALPGTLPAREARRVLRTFRTDREAAFLSLNRALEPCMAREGFRTTFCGASDEPSCPVDEPSAGDDLSDEHMD